MQNPKLLILDEPTAVLTPDEANQLFVVLERLKSEGRAILYISHKLEEVKRLCDRATILRGGKKVATCDPRRETAASLARMMVGGEIGEVKPASGRALSAPRLVVQGLTLETDDPHGVRLEEVSIEVKGGEILGIAGVAGNGQDELFAALSGERLAPGLGAVRIDGQAVGRLSVTERRRRGAAFVPEERLGHATAPQMKLSDNALLTGHAEKRYGEARSHQQECHACCRRPHHQRLRRAQGQAGSRGRKPLRRQPAEIRGRPRDPA
jgi:simple sugar transport system ATP-binding protein